METETCRRAFERLDAYFESSDQQSSLDTAIHHLCTCIACTHRLTYLVRALSKNEGDPLTCDICLDLLPEYHLAVAGHQADQPIWQQVSLHMDTCPYCSAAYRTLSDLVELVIRTWEDDPPLYPVFSLMDLVSKRDLGQATRPQSLLIKGRPLLFQMVVDVLHSVQPSIHSRAAFAFNVKRVRSPQVTWQWSMVEEAQDLEVDISAKQLADQDRSCIVVEVKRPSRGGWPNLGGTEVQLAWNNGTSMTQTTDAFGKAVFDGIASDIPFPLILEIKDGI